MLSQWQIIVINTAIFFGNYVIISSALNFQFGNGARAQFNITGLPASYMRAPVSASLFREYSTISRMISSSAGL